MRAQCTQQSRAVHGSDRGSSRHPHLLYRRGKTDPAALSHFVPLEHLQQELSISYLQTLQLVRSRKLAAIPVGGRKQWRVSIAALADQSDGTGTELGRVRAGHAKSLP